MNLNVDALDMFMVTEESQGHLQPMTAAWAQEVLSCIAPLTVMRTSKSHSKTQWGNNCTTDCALNQWISMHWCNWKEREH